MERKVMKLPLTTLLCLVLMLGVAKAEFAPPVAKMSFINGFGTVADQEHADFIKYDLSVNYAEGMLFNPRTGLEDHVRLRSYSSSDTSKEKPFAAPVMKIKPGDTFRLSFKNELPKEDPSCPQTIDDINTPHCFNSTNMHLHGMWVSPAGNSDNVLLSIRPGVSFEYEYNIPPDHPAGTFWYHPHLHGATAIQTASGMSGPLIVVGDRQPTPDTPGDIDVLLQDSDGALADNILMLQQIPYACRDARGEVKSTGNGVWSCDDGDVGEIETYDNMFGQGDWAATGRFTSINSEILPIIQAGKAGTVSRWRFLHAGFEDSIRPRFRAASDTSRATRQALIGNDDADHADFLKDVCGGETVPQFSFALDGITRTKFVQQDEATLHSGYREDVLMVFPRPGIYCLIDESLPQNTTVSARTKTARLMGFVSVSDGPENTDPGKVVEDVLVAAAASLSDEIRLSVIEELRNDLRIPAFAPHDSLFEVEPDGYQTLGFLFDGTSFMIGNIDKNGNLESPAPYDPERIDRNLVLGHVEDWELRSYNLGHPFHIHVNPFQILEVLDHTGKDVSVFGDDNTSPYANLKGAWKDTIFVTQETLEDGSTPSYIVRVRTRYRRFVGQFVLHCHILDHEDKGMMQNVMIHLPDGNGGFATKHH